MAILPEDYFKCVLALGRKPESDWIATGFLCSKVVGEKQYHFLVTNKHVFEDEKELYVRLYNKKTKDYESLKVSLFGPQGEMLHSAHPTEDVSAAVIHAGLLLDEGFTWIGFDVEKGMMASTDYYAEGGDVGSRVFMLGFPMGLVDKYKNDPICRGGYLARKEETGYLLDIQNFPGNSGSPIISCPEFVTVPGTKAMKSCALIGIISSYIPYRKPLYDMQTKSVVEVRDENSGLANACSVEIIREVIDMELKRFGISKSHDEGNSLDSSLPQ